MNGKRSKAIKKEVLARDGDGPGYRRSKKNYLIKSSDKGSLKILPKRSKTERALLRGANLKWAREQERRA